MKGVVVISYIKKIKLYDAKITFTVIKTCI